RSVCIAAAVKHGYAVPAGRAHGGRSFDRLVPELDVRIALAILSARKRRGLTRQQAASALGISQQAYRKLESPGKSNPTLRTLERISAVLGLDLQLRAARAAAWGRGPTSVRPPPGASR